MRKVCKGTKVIYIPGNHDEFARDYVGLRFGHLHIESQVIHTTADGRRLLVLHGDEFDGVIGYARWLSMLGAGAYQVALQLSQWVNQARRRLGLPYWSLSAYLKYKTKRAVQFIADFEAAVVQAIRAHDVDGIVCGHIHHAEVRTIDGGLLYANTGDWVESCTALVEHINGRLELLRWVLVESPPTDAAPRGDGRIGFTPVFTATTG